MRFASSGTATTFVAGALDRQGYFFSSIKAKPEPGGTRESYWLMQRRF
jgi:hypothetical protein